MFAVTANSQNLWQSLVIWLKSGSVVDSSYIYQRPACFSVDGNFNMQNFTVSMNTDYSIRRDNVNSSGVITDSAWVPGSTSMNFSGGVKTGVGVGIGYGNLGLGYGFNLGADDKKGSRTFNFAIKGHKWGVGINYYGLNHYARSVVDIADDTSRWHLHDERVSNQPCDVYRVALDAYWSLNRSKFAYTAAYKCGMVQRRSAGSMIICGNLLFSGMQCAENDQMFSTSGIQGYNFLQTSVGVGYSRNIVFLHRDATDQKNSNLRNLVFNFTIMPMLTFSNSMLLTPIGGGENMTLSCPVSPNVNGSLALGYSMGRLFMGIQYSHSVYYIQSSEDLKPSDIGLQDRPLKDISFDAVLQYWTVKAMAVFNF